MRIDLWSDVVCPFCLIGKRHLELALEQFPHRDEVEIVWHSFELDPNAPTISTQSLVEMVAHKYGATPAQAEASQVDIARRAAAVGLEFNWREAKPGNTFNAHRLIHLAAATGGGALADVVAKALIKAYFTDGVAIGTDAELRTVAIDAGLSAADVDRVLTGSDYTEEVRADEAQAHQLGISGVPFFLFEEKWAISGAQPVEAFVQGLHTVWEATHPQPQAPAFVDLGGQDNNAPSCGPEGC